MADQINLMDVFNFFFSQFLHYHLKITFFNKIIHYYILMIFYSNHIS